MGALIWREAAPGPGGRRCSKEGDEYAIDEADLVRRITQDDNFARSSGGRRHDKKIPGNRGRIIAAVAFRFG